MYILQHFGQVWKIKILTGRIKTGLVKQGCRGIDFGGFGLKINLGIENQLVEPTTKFDAINRNS